MRKVCVVDACNRKVFGHGLCEMHYKRWRRHGDPSVVKFYKMVGGLKLTDSERHKRWLEKHPLYTLYESMKNRCYYTKGREYRWYGARGICICPEWHKFRVFESQVSPRPSKDHTLDRINNDGNYEPGNVRWVTRKEQTLNNRRTRSIKFNGTVDSVHGWSVRMGIGDTVLRGRFSRGMSPSVAFEVGR